jgi:hypothetical protein
MFYFVLLSLAFVEIEIRRTPTDLSSIFYACIEINPIALTCRPYRSAVSNPRRISGERPFFVEEQFFVEERIAPFDFNDETDEYDGIIN